MFSDWFEFPEVREIVKYMLRLGGKPTHEILRALNDVLPEEAEKLSHNDLVELHRLFHRELGLLGYDLGGISGSHLPKLIIRKFPEERIAALEAFHADAMSGAFPAREQSADIDPRELEGFLERLEARGRDS